MNALRTAILCSLVAGAALGCSSTTAKSTHRDAGHGGDGGSQADGGARSDGGSLYDDGGTFSGSLVISPRNATVDVRPGQAPTVTFSATANGAPVSPSWSSLPDTLGSIDGQGVFTPTGSAGGTATITADFGNATDSVTLLIRLHLGQNGADDGGIGTEDGGAGGAGGVGGEGQGAPVDAATEAVLQSSPTADPSLALLYPYEGTVWPKGILAPLIQWQAGAQAPTAVRLHLECSAFVWDGMFSATATPFAHHPIPQSAWHAMNDACAGDTVQLSVILAAGGVAYGPLTESWKISTGSLRGVVYYNSYGTKLAYNYSGALGGNGQFGGATLAVHGGSTDPVLVAGQSGGLTDCRVCHVVSADGSTLLSQHGDDYGATSSYALKTGNTETPMSPDDGRFAWGGISPDGTLLFSNSAPLIAASTADSALFQVPSGAPVVTSGLSPGFRAGTPVFSPDGSIVAFNWYAGPAGSGTGDAHTLAMMRFNPPGSFSDFTPLYTPANGQTAIYPTFLPTGTGVIFENEVVNNGRGFGETRSTCDDSSSCSDTGARGELWWVDLGSGIASRLDKANGLGVAPVGPNGHDDDSTLNFEPTASPLASGGYAWVIFTSRRMYGNVATINPYWSDPRFHDISVTPTPKKLWVAAVDLNAPPGTDPSHPAFYLPAQELLAGNSRGYWSLDPCKADGEGCGGGDECCGGFCRGNGELKTCGSQGSGCSQEYEKCTVDADCCDATNGVSCVNGRCSIVFR